MKRILSLLLITILLYAIPGCKRDEPALESAFHTELSFSELTDSGTEAALEIARANELLFRIMRSEISGKHAHETLDARTEALKALETDTAIAYVRYCMDVTNEANRQKYDTLSIQTETLACILTDAALLLSEDPALKGIYDAETVETLMREDALSDEAILPLLEQELALVGEYEALSEKLSVEYRGKMWTGDEILSDPTLAEEDFAAMYESYLDLFNAEAGAIFLKLIRVRRMLAQTLGFGSYADYRYACCGRDYTPEDAERLSEQVHRVFVPLFSRMPTDYYRAAMKLYGAAFERETTMEQIGTAVSAILPELNEPWNYMISHNMYDLGTDFDRMPGSFTAYFATYGAPFLFGNWTDGFDAIPMVIHEFGRYASLYLHDDRAEGPVSTDLAEFDAQGLELLAVLQYDTIYGDLSEAARSAELFYAFYALIDGCVEDRFQQFAYTQQEPSMETLNAEYERLCTEYKLDAFGMEGRSWTQVQQTFQSPFYSIGCAASMISALELFLIGTEDPDAAENAYRTVLSRSSGATFREVLDEAGLGDPLDRETLTKTAYELQRIQ